MIKIDGKTVYLATGATDCRKSINTLSVVVQHGFKLNPFSAAVFVFCNRNRDIVKILEWDTDGFWLHTKRLERGRFRWPTAGDGDTMTLTVEELGHLLGSTKVIGKIMRREVKTGPIA